MRLQAGRSGASGRRPAALSRLRRGAQRLPQGHHAHWRLEGSRTTSAAEYDTELCRQWAEAVRAAKLAEEPILAEKDLDTLDDNSRPRYERPALNEWIASHPWHLAFVHPARVGDHINLKELRAAMYALRMEARINPDTRQLYALDSRVALGCGAKGRSASSTLNHELRASLPDVLAFGHYPGYLFVPTRLNTSDDPTRNRPVRAPRSHGPLTGIDAEAVLRRMLCMPTQPRSCSEWAIMVWKLLYVQPAPPPGQRLRGPRMARLSAPTRQATGRSAKGGLMKSSMPRCTIPSRPSACSTFPGVTSSSSLPMLSRRPTAGRHWLATLTATRASLMQPVLSARLQPPARHWCISR